MIYAYITIANCQPTMPEVLDSLTEHPLVKGVFIHPTKAFSRKKSQRYKNIAVNRAEVFKLAIAVGDEYFLISNSDLVHNGIEIDTMMDFMKSNQDHGAVGYHTKARPSKMKQVHVGTGLLLIRTKAVENLDFVMRDDDRCDCARLTEALHTNGWKIDNVGYDRSAVPLKFLR